MKTVAEMLSSSGLCRRKRRKTTFQRLVKHRSVCQHIGLDPSPVHKDSIHMRGRPKQGPMIDPHTEPHPSKNKEDVNAKNAKPSIISRTWGIGCDFDILERGREQRLPIGSNWHFNSRGRTRSRSDSRREGRRHSLVVSRGWQQLRRCCVCMQHVAILQICTYALTRGRVTQLGFLSGLLRWRFAVRSEKKRLSHSWLWLRRLLGVCQCR